MGVISEHIEERDAQGRPDSDGSTEQASTATSAEERLTSELDPFLQQYVTEEYQADAATVDQILTGLIAVGNLL
ncbi:ORF 26 [Haloarcula hispanica virus SH1]|uniref:ORF 26 n=1 Tax=Haloarcula hispanica SH1 virus TaxID=326574 RepID=Q4KPG1_9VIRU|nr:ORF 26 [Haloarcula hispanica virus SH1]AAY24952.1 ORF 26 [Haloarcula hispanica virus SH1]